jgi:hypothetical protein
VNPSVAASTAYRPGSAASFGWAAKSGEGPVVSDYRLARYAEVQSMSGGRFSLGIGCWSVRVCACTTGAPCRQAGLSGQRFDVVCIEVSPSTDLTCPGVKRRSRPGRKVIIAPTAHVEVRSHASRNEDPPAFRARPGCESIIFDVMCGRCHGIPRSSQHQSIGSERSTVPMPTVRSHAAPLE